MELVALPAFTDNYIWMLHDGRDALVVDPGSAPPVMDALHQRGLTLKGILVTHRHADHTGGIAALREVLQGPVIGPFSECEAVCDVDARAGTTFNSAGIGFTVLDLSGHTSGHVGYLATPTLDGHQKQLVFCGDTLFSGGCGRLFDGTMFQLARSVARLGELDGDTLVCCAHEYTLSNLRFARVVEPDNEAVEAYTRRCDELRAQGQPTLPSTIGQERAINPFLRCNQPAVLAAARAHGADADDTLTIFSALRSWKDDFR